MRGRNTVLLATLLASSAACSLPDAHWRVGESYRLAGQIDQARVHMERAYELAQEQSSPDLADYRDSLEKLTAAN